MHEITKAQHFTEPPPRYNEATLVKALEEKGIGRPSTYATILSVIQNRDYVEKQQGRFYPSELGMLVSDMLVKNRSPRTALTLTRLSAAFSRTDAIARRETSIATTGEAP